MARWVLKSTHGVLVPEFFCDRRSLVNLPTLSAAARNANRSWKAGPRSDAKMTTIARIPSGANPRRLAARGSSEGGAARVLPGASISRSGDFDASFVIMRLVHHRRRRSVSGREFAGPACRGGAGSVPDAPAPRPRGRRFFRAPRERGRRRSSHLAGRRSPASEHRHSRSP